MKKTAVPSILSFKKIPFIFLAILIFCHSSIIYAGENEQYCKDLLSNIIIKKVAINKDKNEKAIKSFWQNKNGTFLGARYYKISKKVAKKVKIMFMDINSNFRPIYYIENDEASYPKIFKYIELINAKDNSNEMSALKKEINDWIAKYKSYDKEMENLILEYSTLAAYTQKLKELKN